MVLNIVIEQVKETSFLSQVSRSDLSNLDGMPPKLKDGRKMSKMKMAALFGRNLIISAFILLTKSPRGKFKSSSISSSVLISMSNMALSSIGPWS